MRSPRPQAFALTAWLFPRALGIVYLLAFWSLAAQVTGLAGDGGILPARLTLAGARTFVAAQHIGIDRFRLLPTVFWLTASDGVLRAACLAGMMFAALLVAGIAPALMLALLWADYLSLSVIGRQFLAYQWDALLLETGFLAILVVPLRFRDRLADATEPPPIARWMMLWLLFRLMAGSGAVKLASGDPMWRDLTALSVHFETQPLPTPLAWYMHRLPLAVSKAMTAGVLAIELFAPFLMLAGRRGRQLACVLFVGLQLAIALTGNYAFFNVLTVALCIWLLDDRTLAVWMGIDTPASPFESTDDDRRPPASADLRVRSMFAALVAIATVPVSLLAFCGTIGFAMPGAALVAPIADVIAPLRSVNAYGLFAVMTPTRPEIVVEGSDDGETWSAYEFKYKPGDPSRRPPWVAPHQPRLDWQMWFAALDDAERAPWFQNFCIRLLQGSPDVLQMLDRNPFPARPPRLVRGVLYRYRFSDGPTQRATGAWWTRERLGPFSQPLSLDAIDRRRAPAR